jgi:hypothetical protein
MPHVDDDGRSVSPIGLLYTPPHPVSGDLHLDPPHGVAHHLVEDGADDPVDSYFLLRRAWDSATAIAWASAFFLPYFLSVRLYVSPL